MNFIDFGEELVLVTRLWNTLRLAISLVKHPLVYIYY
jgi:hypothetical protein